jgi:hypothetical protein
MSSTRVPQMDWQQVVMNGGPPCFATLDDDAGRFCGRAQRWDGHDYEHKFVSLEDYVRQRELEVRAEYDLKLSSARDMIKRVRNSHRSSRNQDYEYGFYDALDQMYAALQAKESAAIRRDDTPQEGAQSK